jgi:hypothetical protein
MNFLCKIRCDIDVTVTSYLGNGYRERDVAEIVLSLGPSAWSAFAPALALPYTPFWRLLGL